MFLRKWKTGQLTVGLFVVALLVLGGINLTGLVKGGRALNEAEALRFFFRWGVVAVEINFTAKTMVFPDGSVRCAGDGISCIYFSPPANQTADGSVELSPDEVFFSF